MKPFGLTNPHAPAVKPYAVVQLRQDNKLGTLFNMVGFQTKLKHGEQARVFRTIPGLENAPSSRGSAGCTATPSSTRRSCSTRRCGSRPMPRLRFAGQITGCEGYVESAAIGLLAGALRRRRAIGEARAAAAPTTAHGALLAHITGGHIETIDAGPRSFQPMNVNFGLFPPLAQAPPRPPTASGCAAPPRHWPRSARSRRRALADLEALDRRRRPHSVAAAEYHGRRLPCSRKTLS